MLLSATFRAYLDLVADHPLPSVYFVQSLLDIIAEFFLETSQSGFTTAPVNMSTVLDPQGSHGTMKIEKV